MIASLIILRRNRSKQYKQNFSVSSTSTTIPWKAKFINGHIYFELKDQWASLARSQKHPVLAGSWVEELLSIWMQWVFQFMFFIAENPDKDLHLYP